MLRPTQSISWHEGLPIPGNSDRAFAAPFFSYATREADLSEPRIMDPRTGRNLGNILEAIAALYPAEAARWLRSRPPILAEWNYHVWKTRWRRTGYFFEFLTDLDAELRPIFDDLYRAFPRDERYPELYNEDYAGGLPMVCLGGERLVVWVGKPGYGRSSR
jgi:hypothetical protein